MFGTTDKLWKYDHVMTMRAVFVVCVLLQTAGFVDGRIKPRLADSVHTTPPTSKTPNTVDQLPHDLEGPRASGEGFGGSGSVRKIGLVPAYGPTSGGVWVEVVGAGSYFTPNSLTCKLDHVQQSCYSNHYFYSWCYMAPKCSGTYTMECHNGPLRFQGTYAVVAKTPWVTSVYPFSGESEGGTEVTVRGLHFEAHCPQQLLCKFGDQVVPAKYYTPTAVMCVAPCATAEGSVSLEVSNDGGKHWSYSGVQFGFVGPVLSADKMSGCRRYLAVDQLLQTVADHEEEQEVEMHSPQHRTTDTQALHSTGI